MSKVLINYDQLCGLADYARRVGTLDALADVALQWAGQADKEMERLTAALQHEADCVEAAKAEIERLTDEDRRLRADLLAGRNVVNAGLTIHTLTAERDELRDLLLRAGFVQCDIPACNCGSWHHRYGLPERMQEIKDALAEAGHELSNANGNLPINALKALVAERDDLRRQLAEAEQDARRYRWLRGDSCPDHSSRWTQCRADLDDAIDAARGKE